MQQTTKSHQLERRPLLVVGIGNILLRDEGFGPHLIRKMQTMRLPASVELLDGGTAGADLIDYICDRRKVIFIDAVRADAEPGSVFRITEADFTSNIRRSISLHEFGLVETLFMAKLLHCAPKNVILLGITPQDISCGVGLSQKIKALVPTVTDLVLNELRKTA